MKKIIFSERFGLEQAVLAGTKTMTRCIIPGICDYSAPAKFQPKYEVGEEVAIAQPYKNDGVLTYNAYNEDGTAREDGLQRHKEILKSKGYRNKMFVKAEYMPHRIRITGIKVERLQDISEEDAMREGVFKYDKPPMHHEADMFAPWAPYVRPYKWDSDNLIYRCTARYAFAVLIDRISGRGTWQRNPWVYAYTFAVTNLEQA